MSVQSLVLDVEFPCAKCAQAICVRAESETFSCRCPHCGASYEVRVFGAVECLTGVPSKVVGQLALTIANLVSAQEVKHFYIGRSNNVLARNGAHHADHIIELYRTRSVDNAMAVEDALIKAFIDHDKNWNDADHSGGNVGPGDQYVYVALWY